MEEYRINRLEVRTDLALEERERFPGDGGEVAGVSLREWEEPVAGVRLTEVVVEDERGVRAMRKPVGTYLTLEAPRLAEKDEDFHREVSEELGRQLVRLMGRRMRIEGGGRQKRPESRQGVGGVRPSVLVIGLGNANATPDALGPKVLEHLQVTRHLARQYGPDFCEKHGYPVLSGLTPGVMAQTGMETAEIIRGVVQETGPDAVLVVDALAAGHVHRLGTTIQLTDTGIHPGSGVGNHRNSLTEETLGVPVFAIGVPTVIRATLDPEFGPMFVTPHDIDERIDMLSFTISEAIHCALFRQG